MQLGQEEENSREKKKLRNYQRLRGRRRGKDLIELRFSHI
jgi:hypothetical protein